MGRIPSQQDVRCSFCGKSPDRVKKLVAGPGVYICNECIDLCNEVMRQPTPPPQPARST